MRQDLETKKEGEKGERESKGESRITFGSRKIIMVAFSRGSELPWVLGWGGVTAVTQWTAYPAQLDTGHQLQLLSFQAEVTAWTPGQIHLADIRQS